MTKFRGKNGLPTKELIYERVRYSAQAFGRGPGDALYPLPVKDFGFGEKVLYGRINIQNNSITPNTYRLRTIESREDPRREMRALDFVCDAFKGFVRDFNKGALDGKIETTDPDLTSPTAKIAFIDPIPNYQEYINSVATVFYNQFLTPSRREQIRDFQTFVPLFQQFLLEMSVVAPITFTSFITSTYCGPFNTGLTISLTNYDASDDLIKGDFISRPNFKFYQIAAQNNGFSISKNAPWIITADINSPPMLDYAARRGLSGKEMVLEVCYRRAESNDLANLEELMFKTYNLFAIRAPQTKIRHTDGSRRTICRNVLSLEEFREKYPDIQWVDIYSEIRYNEQRKPGSKAFLEEVKRDAKDIQLQNGTRSMQTFINDNIRGYANYFGSYADRDNRALSHRGNRSIKSTY